MPPKWKDKDRRKAERVDIAIDVEFVFRDRKMKTITENASTTGFFMKVDEPIPLGTKLAFHLGHPKFKALVRLEGQVVHALTRTLERQTGVGIHIQPGDPEQNPGFLEYRTLVKSLFPK